MHYTQQHVSSTPITKVFSFHNYYTLPAIQQHLFQTKSDVIYILMYSLDVHERLQKQLTKRA